MKKIALFIFLLVLSSCWNNTPTNINQEANTPESWVIATSTPQSQNTNVGERIANDPGYNQCIENARYTCGNQFISAYALNNASTDVCDQFNDDNLKNSCKDMVITETAKKTLDADRCNELKDSEKKLACRQDVLILKWVKNSDPTICSNIEISSSEVDSLENIKDKCVLHIIQQLKPNEKTKWLCGLLISEESKNACENHVQDEINIQNQTEWNQE